MNYYKHPWHQELADYLGREPEPNEINLLIAYRKKMTEHIMLLDGTVNPYKDHEGIAYFAWQKIAQSFPDLVEQAI